MTAFRCIVVMLAACATSCDRPSPVFARLVEANRLTAELLVRFTKAADAANRAVMADTDEASIQYATEAKQETSALQHDSDRLAKLLQSLQYADETKLLNEFREAFAKYRTLDQETLGLAVENTNLKAQRLSFGPAEEAVGALQAALDPFVRAESGRAESSKESWHARALALTAILALREIQVLEAPHIAAAEDAAMTAFEQRMAASEAKARSALGELATLGGSAAQSAIDAANAALNRFVAVHAQILALSRRNTNVRSLALALGQKRTLTMECEAKLHALSERIAQRGFPGTR